MANKPKYYIIEASALPVIFPKGGRGEASAVHR